MRQAAHSHGLKVGDDTSGPSEIAAAGAAAEASAHFARRLRLRIRGLCLQLSSLRRVRQFRCRRLRSSSNRIRRDDRRRGLLLRRRLRLSRPRLQKLRNHHQRGEQRSAAGTLREIKEYVSLRNSLGQ